MKPNKSLIAIIVVAVLLMILAGNGCSTYNSLVKQDESVQQTWAQVENQYQRRLDLIPNLVATVKGYAAHESETFQAVTEARAGLTNAYNAANGLKDSANPDDQQAFDSYTQAQSQLQRALSVYVNAVREAYPDLKANQQFLDLQTQLEGTENRIATERGRYTEAVKAYNLNVRRFPANIWAGMFGFSAKSQFQAEAAAQSAPKVEF